MVADPSEFTPAQRVAVASAIAYAGLGSALVAYMRPLSMDEGYSAWAVSLPWRDFVNFVTNDNDIVHAAYYLVLRAVAGIWGLGPLSIRLPSAVFMAAACGGVAWLGWRLSGGRVAVASAFAFALLPVTVDLGGEARSPALAVAAVTWATVALVAALRRPHARVWRWVVYAASIAFASYVFLYSILLVVVHLGWVLLTCPGRGVRWRLLGSQAAAVVMMLPLVFVAIGQQQQVAWIPPLSVAELAKVPLASVYSGGRVLALATGVLVWLLVGNGLAAGLKRARDASAASSASSAAMRYFRAPQSLATLGWLWIGVPSLILALVSIKVPLLTPRYLAISAPGFALLIGLGLAAITRRWVLIATAATGTALSLLALAVALLSPGRDAWADKRALIEQFSQPEDVVVFIPDTYEFVYRLEPVPGVAILRLTSGIPPAPDIPSATLTTPTAPDVPAGDATDQAADGAPATVWVVRHSSNPLYQAEADEVARTLAAAGYVPTAVYSMPGYLPWLKPQSADGDIVRYQRATA